MTDKRKVMWIDVETTGLSATKNRIIELAMLYENFDNPKDKDSLHRYCKPDVKPDDWDQPKTKNGKTISEYTGITWELLEEKGVSEKQLYEDVLIFLKKHIAMFESDDKAIFAAFNASFDNRFIRELFLRNNDDYFGSFFYSPNLDILSTVGLAKKQGLLPQLDNYQNVTVARHFGIKFKAHSAAEDIKASRQIQLKLEKLLNIGYRTND